jgi:thymidylate synthase (FAD)
LRIIKPSFEILTNVDTDKVLRDLSEAGRTCYKSSTPPTKESNILFVKNIIKRGHESVLEHFSISVRVICDRGVSHEIVRHRLFSFSQESQRYVNYKGEGIEVISPCFWKIDSEEYKIWETACKSAENSYMRLISRKVAPEQARTILPNSTKMELVMTANLREWRHFFKVRAEGITGKPHPQMLELSLPMLEKFKELLPPVFEDILK